MQIPPRHIIFKNTNLNSVLDYLLSEVTPQLIQSIKEKRENRFIQKTSINNDISEIMKWLKKTRSQSESELVNYFYQNPQFREIYTKRTFSLNFKKALQLEMQSCLDTPILQLSKDFNDHQNSCLCPLDSFQLVKKWCKFQNIIIRNYLLDILNILDHMKKEKKNFIFMWRTKQYYSFSSKGGFFLWGS